MEPQSVPLIRTNCLVTVDAQRILPSAVEWRVAAAAIALHLLVGLTDRSRHDEFLEIDRSQLAGPRKNSGKPDRDRAGAGDSIQHLQPQ